MPDSHAYEATHPWLTFQIDLRRVDYQTWMNLGAAQSKCEHVARVMVPPPIGRKLRLLYLAKGVAATTAIEGNTLSEREVRRRIRKKQPLPPSQEYQGRRFDNIVAACNEIDQQMINDDLDCTITPERIERFNDMVLRRAALGRGRCAGHCAEALGRRCRLPGAAPGLRLPSAEALRLDQRFEIVETPGPSGFRCPEGGVGPPLLGVDPSLRRRQRPYRTVDRVPDSARRRRADRGGPPVEQPLQPDAIGILPPTLAVQQDEGRLVPFVQYAVLGFVDQLDQQIQWIREYQHAVVWKDYVYERFRGRKRCRPIGSGNWPSNWGGRKPLIVAGIIVASAVQRLLPVEIVTRLTADLAEAYAGKTRKTVTRYINALEAMGPIVRQAGAPSGRRPKPSGRFLPSRRPEASRQ